MTLRHDAATLIPRCLTYKMSCSAFFRTIFFASISLLSRSQTLRCLSGNSFSYLDVFSLRLPCLSFSLFSGLFLVAVWLLALDVGATRGAPIPSTPFIAHDDPRLGLSSSVGVPEENRNSSSDASSDGLQFAMDPLDPSSGASDDLDNLDLEEPGTHCLMSILSSLYNYSCVSFSTSRGHLYSWVRCPVEQFIVRLG